MARIKHLEYLSIKPLALGVKILADNIIIGYYFQLSIKTYVVGIHLIHLGEANTYVVSGSRTKRPCLF